MHTLAARPSSGTDLQCCWAVVRPRWVTERGEKERERSRERAVTLVNFRRAPVWRYCTKRTVPTENPQSDHGSKEVKKQKRKRQPGDWAADQGFIWDYWDSSCMFSCHADIVWYPLRSVFYWPEPLSVLDLPRLRFAFFNQRSACVKLVAAGSMSSGPFSHLLRGIWLMWLWQGKASPPVSRNCLKGFP